MASRILSRFLPGLDDDDSRDDQNSRLLPSSLESAQLERFHDHADNQELDDLVLGDQPESPDDPHQLAVEQAQPISPLFDNAAGVNSSPADEDDVPESFMMEEGRIANTSRLYTDDPSASPTMHRTSLGRLPPHPPSSGITHPTLPTAHHVSPLARVDSREQALWRWTNVINLDGFLLQVYQYYIDHGIWSILLSRSISLLTTLFLFSMYIFLSSCIDFSKVPLSKSTDQVLIAHCLKDTPFLKTVMIWVFAFWWISTLCRYMADVRRLWHLHQFYHYLLDIADSDIQTIPWERVVEGLMTLRDLNPETAAHVPPFLANATAVKQSKQRMDAHDIANRLMRRDNYHIAMIDKDVIDYSLYIPFLGHRRFYSRSLEWCIGFCLENFIFDQHGHVQQSCIDVKNRGKMIETLRRRLRFAAIISVFMAPFNIGAHCVYYFSRYYAEFRNSPAQLGARAFTPLAEWRLREFNELEHDLRQRIKMAYPFADRYLNQFPKDKTNQALQFLGLIAGTVAAVLGIATLLDPELFLGFEVTAGRTAFFYLSISMGVFAATRNAIPDDDEVHEPVMHLAEVIRYTHYCPSSWKRQLHSNTVRAEFTALYQMKIFIFAQEILSLVVAPFILWRNSGPQSQQIVDFFRQSTVHVDGMGGLCNYAVFDFRKKKPIVNQTTPATDRGHTETKDEKMAMSQYYFMHRLGQYDQQQANRYQRHVPLAMPPVFPPLSPLAEAAGPAQQVAQTSTPDKQSPRRSVLLDLRKKRTPGGQTGHVRDRRTFSRRALDKEHADDTYADISSSRLIEQDNHLDDSWRVDMDDVGGQQTERDVSGKEQGVLAMLMEYSKAHADGKRAGGRV